MSVGPIRAEQAWVEHRGRVFALAYRPVDIITNPEKLGHLPARAHHSRDHTREGRWT